MGITRRKFLQVTGAAAGAVAFAGCSPRTGELLVQSAFRVPEDLVTGIDNWYATICRMCSGGCGIIVRVMEGRAKKIEGNPDYPVNRGKLCARGQAGTQLLYHPDRIQGPLVRRGDRGSGQFQSIAWDDAMNELTGKLNELRTGQAPGEVLLITPPTRGHLGMVLQRLTQTPGGSFQVASFEPMGKIMAGQGTAQALGIGTSPSAAPLFDVANARFILSFGADFLDSGPSPVQYSVAYGQFRGRQQGRGVLVQIEPRITSTGASADQWIPIKPGTEGVLALGIAQVIVSEGLATQGAGQSGPLASGTLPLQSYSPQTVSDATGVPQDKIVSLARRFASQGPSIAIAGGPAVAQSNGPFNLNAILALNQLAGNLGQAGGVLPNPPSPLPEVPVASTGWPGSWWQGLVEAINSGQPWPPDATTPSVSPPKIIIVRGANPVHGLPSAFGFRDALGNVPYLVSFSSFMDETAAMADIILPEHTYLEDWGSDVPEPGPGFQVVGFQQPVVNPIYDTRSFGDTLLSISSRLGANGGLPWKTFKEVLQEGARELMNGRGGSIQAAGTDEYWIRLLQRGGWWDENTKGTLPTTAQGASILPTEAGFSGSEQDYPFILLPFPSNGIGTGSGANLPWLQATPDPITTAVWVTWVEINLGRGREMGLEEGDIVRVESPQGSLEAPVYLHPGIRPDVVAIPMGQGHTAYGRWAKDRGANVLDLLSPMIQQPDGGLAWAATRVKITRTGKTGRVSKAEGRFFAAQPPDVEIVGVVRQ